MSSLPAPIAAPGISSLMTLFGAVRHDARGFVNTADLAKASRTTAQAYLKNGSNVLFVQTLAEKLGASTSDLMTLGHGGSDAQDPMCHPEVAVDLARWSNPVLGVELGLVLHQFFSGELTTEHSVAANQVCMYVNEFMLQTLLSYLVDEADGWSHAFTLLAPHPVCCLRP